MVGQGRGESYDVSRRSTAWKLRAQPDRECVRCEEFDEPSKSTHAVWHFLKEPLFV